MLLNSPVVMSERDPALQTRVLLALNLEFEKSPVEGCWGTLICDAWGDLVLNSCRMQHASPLVLPSLWSSLEIFPISSTHWAVILILSSLCCWICAAPSSCACRLRSWGSCMDRKQQLLCSALLCSIPLQWPWWIFSTFFSILGWGGHGCGCWETLLPVCRNTRLKPSPRALPPFLLPSLPILSERKSGGLFVLALHGQDSSSMLVSEPSSSPHLRSCRITSSPSCTPIFPFYSDASLHVMHRESL